MSTPIPPLLRAAAGLAAVAIDSARKAPRQLISLPVLGVSTALQASLKAQQAYAGLVARGDEVLGALRGQQDSPPWATFDEDEPARPARSAFDAVAEEEVDRVAEAALEAELEAELVDRALDPDVDPDVLTVADLTDPPAPAVFDVVEVDIDPAELIAAAEQAGVEVVEIDLDPADLAAATDAADLAAVADLAGADLAGAADLVDLAAAADLAAAEAGAGVDAAAIEAAAGLAGDLEVPGADVVDPGGADLAGADGDGELADVVPISAATGDRPAGSGTEPGVDLPAAGAALTADAAATGAALAAEAAVGGGGDDLDGYLAVDPPVPGYDGFSIPQLRGRLRRLTLEQVEELLAYERAHGSRPAYLTMLENRVTTLRSR